MDRRQQTFEQAKQFLQSGNLAAARELLEPLIKQDVESTEVRFLLALCCFRLGEFTAAEKHFLEVTRRAPRDHNAAYYLGLSLEKQGRIDAALTAFRTAQHIKPDFAQANEKIAAQSRPQPTPGSAGTERSPSPPPTRKWSWYSTRAGDPDPPFLYKIAHWGCLAFIVLFILGMVAMLAGLIISQARF